MVRGSQIFRTLCSQFTNNTLGCFCRPPRPGHHNQSTGVKRLSLPTVALQLPVCCMWVSLSLCKTVSSMCLTVFIYLILPLDCFAVFLSKPFLFVWFLFISMSESHPVRFGHQSWGVWGAWVKRHAVLGVELGAPKGKACSPSP